VNANAEVVVNDAVAHEMRPNATVRNCDLFMIELLLGVDNGLWREKVQCNKMDDIMILNAKEFDLVCMRICVSRIVKRQTDRLVFRVVCLFDCFRHPKNDSFIHSSMI
jgi:hypothetical protein